MLSFDDLVTDDEVVKRLGVSKRSVLRYCDEGLLMRFVFKRRTYFLRQVLIAQILGLDVKRIMEYFLQKTKAQQN